MAAQNTLHQYSSVHPFVGSSVLHGYIRTLPFIHRRGRCRGSHISGAAQVFKTLPSFRKPQHSLSCSHNVCNCHHSASDHNLRSRCWWWPRHNLANPSDACSSTREAGCDSPCGICGVYSGAEKGFSQSGRIFPSFRDTTGFP